MITLRLQTAHRGKEEPLQQAGGYNHRRLALQRRRKQIDSLNYLQDQEKWRYKRRKNVAQKLGSVLHETGKPTQNKTKQTMRQTANSPERGKPTNRKRAGRKMLQVKGYKTKNQKTKIQETSLCYRH
jgi:hypothetical protein